MRREFLLHHLTWRPAQQRVLLVILSAIICVTAVMLWMNPTDVSDPQPSAGDRAGELADRIDPNIADWSTLAVLPGIGPGRAQGIIEYRERTLSRDPHRPAFVRPFDLLKVDGIGAKVLIGIEPYLIFPPSDVPPDPPVPPVPPGPLSPPNSLPPK